MRGEHQRSRVHVRHDTGTEGSTGHALFLLNRVPDALRQRARRILRSRRQLLQLHGNGFAVRAGRLFGIVDVSGVLTVACIAWIACITAGCRSGASGKPFTRESVLEQVRGHYPEASLPPDDLPRGVTAHENVTYVRRGDRDLKLDVYRPTGPGPHPAVIVVHGGGWESGDRTMERPFAKRLAERGFVAVPVSYRLGPDGRFPNALFDLKQAVRWLRKNAARYEIGPQQIAAVGGSAGGQLVALLGATNGVALVGDGSEDADRTNRTNRTDRTDTAGVGETSADIQAAVVIDGLADFTGPALREKESRTPGAPVRFLGGPYVDRADTWRQASALTHVGPRSAPTLFINSTASTPILPGRSEMSGKLRSLGIASEIVVITDSPHPFWLVNPWFAQTLEHTDRFLRRYLDAH
jgi:acetyl esterase/lipase